MTTINQLITKHTNTYLSATHHVDAFLDVECQNTRKEFDGDLTVVIFPLLKYIKTKPEILATEIGIHLVSSLREVKSYNVIKGFLNLVISEDYYIKQLLEYDIDTLFKENSKPAIMVEFSSPNTNKPLHLGHIRNILLGDSVSRILKFVGHKIYKTQIINDRGIHTCKSMVAWQLYGNEATPESTHLKGDAFVGKYYVKYNEVFESEVNRLCESGSEKKEAEQEAPIYKAASEMLQKWENGDAEILSIWRKMNEWVYAGFEETYRSLNVTFDKLYYESQTYLLGKKIVSEGLQKGIFYKKPDGSVAIDLSQDGLDEKILLRKNGTSVYITQDLGTATQRAKDFSDLSGMIYTVGNEQDYHFKVLFCILKKLGVDWSNYLYHLSYAMVDLPDGKMKSREGNVVDADDLINDMIKQAKTASEISNNLNFLDSDQKESLFHTLGLGALKYYILKIDPRKRILFNPKESIDLNGNTASFVQYAYARIQSIQRKAEDIPFKFSESLSLHKKEKELIKRILNFKDIVVQSADQLNPALVANYCYDLVKTFNSYYQSVPIIDPKNKTQRTFRVWLCKKIGHTIKVGFSLLGIDVPNRM